MFKVPTVIIVGAGASFDFGYPLGPNLLSNIIGGIVDAKRIYQLGSGHRPTIATDLDFLKYQYPIAYENASSYLGCTTTELVKFAEIANSQTNKSVDRFLRDHPNLQKIGKYFIAQEIVQKSYSMIAEQVLPKNFRIGTPGWIGELINEMREGTKNTHDLKENKITLVTFNYDLSIEMALDAQFANTDIHRGADWRACVEVIHVYGQVEPPKETFVRQEFLDDIKKSARSIKIIGDVDSSQITDGHLEKIREKISKAERVISLGFSFDQANVELLALNENRVGPKMTVLNYDGHYGVKRLLGDLDVKSSNIFAPEVMGGKMTIIDAIGFGLFTAPISNSVQPGIVRL